MTDIHTTPSGIPPNVGRVLAELRKQAGKSQGEVARSVEVDASRISRIENGVFEPAADELLSVLGAINSPEAEGYAAYLGEQWRFTERPPFGHPSYPDLRSAEQAVQKLDEFRREEASPLVVPRLDLMERELRRAAGHLRRLDYRLAFIGDVGVGKTTLICVLSELVLGTGIKDASVVLETGPGRTTICDVEIAMGDRSGLVVEGYPSDDIYALASDLCEGIWARLDSDSGELGKKGVSQEIERALRSMAGLPRPRRPKRVAGQPRAEMPPDPLFEIARNEGSLQALIAEFCQRLSLPTRTQRELWVPEGEEPKRWLAQMFRSVNNGRLPSVTLPKTIRVILDRSPFDAGEFAVSVVDTKGLDGTAMRPDLREHRDDDRVLLLLCSRFENAPASTVVEFLVDGIEEGAEASLRERSAILVLPRGSEAEELKDDGGIPVEDVESGYDFREEQVATEVAKLGLAGLESWFADAARQPDITLLRDSIHRRLRQVREAYASSISELAIAVRTAVENHAHQASELAHERVREDLTVFLAQHSHLPSRKYPTDGRLLALINNSHPRTVWAMTRRSGNWLYLNAPTAVGAAAVVDARQRAATALSALDAILDNLLGNSLLEPAHPYIKSLRTSLPHLKKEFYAQARLAGTLTHREALGNAESLWTGCVARYGLGPGYRNDVASRVKGWFHQEAQAPLEAWLETKIDSAWAKEVVSPLRVQIGS